MPTPQHIIDAARKRRERICPICGKEFLASRPSAKGLCSKACQAANFSRLRTGTKQSDETKAKRIQSLAAFRLANPEREKARTRAAANACRTDEYRRAALERYLAMNEGGYGICSDQIRSFTAERAKWVMKKCREALNNETDFPNVWGRVLDRVRLENPYDGPLDSSDYFDYCKKIGKIMTRDPEIRALQDGFMKEALPRFSAEYNSRFGDKAA